MDLLCTFVSLLTLASLAASHPHHHTTSGAPTLTDLQNVQDKLDLILESETREKKLIEGFLLFDRSPTGPVTSEVVDAVQETSTTISVAPAAIAESEDTPTTSFLVEKLQENSKRMETMVVFLADLRNVLSEAVGSQEKQETLKTQVIQLREETEYLREQVEKLKSDQHVSQQQSNSNPSSVSSSASKLDNKIKNDETTIQWLKTTVQELRHGLEEVSSSVNVTGLLGLKQQWGSQVNRVDADLRELRKDVQALRATGARNEEALVEIKGDIADLRTWHLKMGQKFSVSQQQQQGQDERAVDETELKHWNERKSTQKKLAEEIIPAKEEESHQRRHTKNKLRSDMKSLALVVHDLVKDQEVIHKRLVKMDARLDNFVSQQKPQTSSSIYKESEEEEEEEEEDFDNVVDRASSAKLPNSRRHWRKRHDSDSLVDMDKIGDDTFTEIRLETLERNVAGYGNTLQRVNDQVNTLTQMQESNSQLFTALEALESKYDQRLTDMQTGLARMEATVSSATVSTDEVRAQQSLHAKEYLQLQKDFIGTKGQVQTNHLRLAAVQSQLVKFGLRTCADANNESIQNIKIASLEAKLR